VRKKTVGTEGGFGFAGRDTMMSRRKTSTFNAVNESFDNSDQRDPLLKR